MELCGNDGGWVWKQRTTVLLLRFWQQCVLTEAQSAAVKATHSNHQNVTNKMQHKLSSSVSGTLMFDTLMKMWGDSVIHLEVVYTHIAACGFVYCFWRNDCYCIQEGPRRWLSVTLLIILTGKTTVCFGNAQTRCCQIVQPPLTE